MNAPNPSLADELNAALAWWEDAGVTHDFANDATDWLAAGQPANAPQDLSAQENSKPSANRAAPDPVQENSVQRVDLLGQAPPSSLDEFRQFWLEAPGLDTIGPRGRIAPRGPATPELMVLVVDPEDSDRDQLLSGQQGALLSKMLLAMGVREESTYYASALPRHTPMADTAMLAASGMDAVTLHHVGLVSPQKLIIFGRGNLPLIGENVSKADTYLREINQNSRCTPVMVSESLESLLASPVLKAKFWRRWIEWTAQLR